MDHNDNDSDVSDLSQRFSQISQNLDEELSETASRSSSERSSYGRQSESGAKPEPERPTETDATGRCQSSPAESRDGEEAEVGSSVATRNNIDKRSKSKNPFKLLRRLTVKSERKDKENDPDPDRKLTKFDRILMEVKVDSLPQVFVTKYLGYKPCHGLWGIKHTRQPVDQLIEDVTSLDPDAGEDLPLVQLRVSLSGIHVREHSANSCTTRRVAKELIPIEFISYGVQDVKHTRIFSFILVREMSSKSRKLECHAYVCDSTASCRRLSLSVALAFKEYSSKLDGKPYKFQVDLRSGDQQADGLNEEAVGGEDFEA